MNSLLSRLSACVLLASAVVPLSAQDTKPGSKPAKDMGWTGVLGEAEFAALHQLKKGGVAKLHGQMIKVGEANAYLSLPKSKEPSAAVLVIHEWWGLNDHVKHWADRLAADGYAALAIDLYGGVVATTREAASKAMQSVDAEKAQATLVAAHAFLKTDKRVAAAKRACIGWCFGGGWSLRLAMAAPDLDAAVVYYGRLVTDATKLQDIRAPLLGVFGTQDRGIPQSSVDAFEKAMKKAGRDVRILRYDANHAFANPSSARYAKEHASAAWREVRGFLDAQLASADRRGRFKVGSANVHYILPKGWKHDAPRPMRNVNLKVEGVSCYVTVLGGGGGVGPNLNRWRGQMGNQPLSQAEIAKLPRLDMMGRKAALLVTDGSYRGMRGDTMKDARMLGVVCEIQGSAVFVKMLGPKKAVAAQQDAFRAFCSSMR